jgi:hypothetical protein
MLDLKNKTFGKYIIILILLLVIFSVYHYFSISDCNKQENMISVRYNKPTWSRNNCPYIMSKTLGDQLNKHGIEQSDDNWDLYFPCGYDDINEEINAMPVVDGAKYFIVDNCDELVAKEWLWKNLVKHYGFDIARTLVPNGYVLYDKDDLERFNKEYDNKKIYIMKKNIQRQEGLKITKSRDEIMNGYKDNYVLVQELLQNPYIISGRKTNMRFYVLVLCRDNEINVFVHKDGFMYYTKDMFKENSTEDGPNITTGYIDRKVYEENPLTHDDLRIFLDNSNRSNLLDVEKEIKNQGLKISEVYFHRIYHTLRSVFMAFVGKICIGKKFTKNNTLFQLFGVDIAVDNKLNSMVIEINKGPDMGAKDDRDGAIKQRVVDDILTTIGSLPKRDSRFIRILDVKNGMINMTDL